MLKGWQRSYRPQPCSVSAGISPWCQRGAAITSAGTDECDEEALLSSPRPLYVSMKTTAKVAGGRDGRRRKDGGMAGSHSPSLSPHSHLLSGTPGRAAVMLSASSRVSAPPQLPLPDRPETKGQNAPTAAGDSLSPFLSLSFAHAQRHVYVR